MANQKAAKTTPELLEEIAGNLPTIDELLAGRPHLQTISVQRGEEFLAILLDIGIGDIINRVVSEDRGESMIGKPISAVEQTGMANGKLINMQDRLRQIQVKIDYNALIQKLVEHKAMTRLACVVLDCKPEEASLNDFNRDLSVFLSLSSGLLSGLTGFVLNSV